jgi:hypothetical protein
MRILNRSSKRNVSDKVQSVAVRFIASSCAVLILLQFSMASSHRLQSGTIDQDPSGDGEQTAQPIVLTVTVTNGRDELVTGLKQEDFVVLVDKVPQKIYNFSDEDVPASIGLLFDVSHSMVIRGSNTAKLRTYKDALKQFLEQSNPSNEYFLIGFSQAAAITHALDV